MTRAEVSHVPTGTGLLVVSTTRARLVDALARVGLVVSRRPAVPVLSGVLLEGTTQGALLVRGFDDTSAVTVRLEGASSGPGRVVVRHHELSKLLGALVTGMAKRDADAAPVTIRAVDGAWATVELGETTLPVELLPVEDFPPVPEVPPTVAHTSRAEFAFEAARVLRAAAGGNEKYAALSGVHVDVVPDGIRLAATDRYRIALGHVAGATRVAQPGQTTALIEAGLLSKLVAKLDGPDVHVGHHPGPESASVAVTSGDTTVVTRSVVGDVPNYAAHVPRTATGTVVVERAALVRQVNRAAAVLHAKNERAMPVALHIDAATVAVRPVLSQGAEHVVTPALPARVAGIAAPMRLGLNDAFLRDALDSVDGHEVSLHVQSATTPVVVTAHPDDLTDSTAFRHVLMPIRLS